MFHPIVFIVNSIIIAFGAITASLMAGVAYSFLRSISGSYFDLFFIMILLACLILFYLILSLLVTLCYRFLLSLISNKETTVYLGDKGLHHFRQQLRTILAGVASDINLPILCYFPWWLHLLSAKVGRNVVVRGRICNPEIIAIGNNVLIGAGSLVNAHLKDGNRLIFKKISIGDNCTIGVKSMILPGVEVGNNSVVGAGSLVPKDTKIPPNEVWAGLPAKKVQDIG